MSSADTDEIVQDGRTGVARHGVSLWTQMAIIGTVVSAVGYAAADVILGIPSTLMAPVVAFSEAVATFLRGTIGAPVIVTDAGATASARSFMEGTGAALGPFAFVLAVVVVVMAMTVMFWFLRRETILPTQLITRD